MEIQFKVVSLSPMDGSCALAAWMLCNTPKTRVTLWVPLAFAYKGT